MDILKPLNELRLRRKIFYSEADFQFAFAWEVQKSYPEAKVRLEYSPKEIEPTIHIDILVVAGEEWYPIELKYKTSSCEKVYENEVFKLKEQSAQDTGRYDYWKDVQRLETFSECLPHYKKGFAILLTNDPNYWTDSGRTNTIFDQFKILDDTTKTGRLSWADHASQGSIKNRGGPIFLRDKYQIHWSEYSKLDNTRTGGFNYLILSH
jgi:hypothetical protein